MISATPDQAQIELAPEPASVRRARHWLRGLLEGCPAAMVATAELLLSELATNAVLHARTPFQLRLRNTPGGRTRIEVVDRAPGLPGMKDYGDDAATGRGMRLLDELALGWGVQPLDQGKVVWFEVHPASSLLAVDVPPADHRRGPERPPAPPVVGGEGDVVLHAVQVLGIPLAELRRCSAQYDGIVREFRLALERDPGARRELPGRLVALMEELTSRYGGFTAGGDAELAAARERGDTVTDVVFRVPAAVGPDAERYDRLLDEADAYCREGEALLSLAPDPRAVALRKWLLGEFVRQLRGEPPVPWSESPWAR